MLQPVVIRIEIPGPPKAWKRAGHRIVRPKGGGASFVSTYTDADTRSEQGVLRMAAAEAMATREPFQGAVDLRVAFYLPVPASWSKTRREAALAGHILPTAKPDADNLAKMIDALKQITWRDDAQVSDLNVRKRYAARPRTVMEIREVHP